MEVITKEERETKKFGEKIAKMLISGKIKKRILALEGELGTGKTTFLKGFAKGLGIKEKILSPTFIIFKKFNIKHPASIYKHFYHIDCYRIKKEKEVLKLGFEKIVSNPKNIVAIEWAEKIKKILPKKKIWIFFEFFNRKGRKILVK